MSDIPVKSPWAPSPPTCTPTSEKPASEVALWIERVTALITASTAFFVLCLQVATNGPAVPYLAAGAVLALAILSLFYLGRILRWVASFYASIILFFLFLFLPQTLITDWPVSGQRERRGEAAVGAFEWQFYHATK